MSMHSAQRTQWILDAILELVDIRVEDVIGTGGGYRSRERSVLLRKHIAALIDGVPLWEAPALTVGDCDGCEAKAGPLFPADASSERMLCPTCLRAALAPQLSESQTPTEPIRPGG